MINQVSLIGRLVRTPELFETENGNKGSFITLAVGRQFKNLDGEYETDFIDCTLWLGVAERAAEYCKTGDIVGIRGRLQTRIVENEDGSKYKRMEVIAERLTFLASARSNDNNHERSVGDDEDENENADS